VLDFAAKTPISIYKKFLKLEIVVKIIDLSQ